MILLKLGLKQNIFCRRWCRNSAKRFFLVDPVSGVKNYSHGISYFASSIVLIIDGKVIASIIYDPIRDEMFFAEKGKGAYLNNSRIRVSSNNKRNRAILFWKVLI